MQATVFSTWDELDRHLHVELVLNILFKSQLIK